jgi:aryl-alcohol dehydrogenase-like predicted oxidoreductase
MEKRKLGQTGFEVTVLGYGSGPVGILGADQNDITEILNQALDQGINLIDTAQVYRGSEAAIGNAVSHRRDEYVLVSKCGRPAETAEGESWRPAALAATVDNALKLLKTDHLDVMLLHSCDLETLKRGEALGVLVAAREAGKVRHVGYSGDNEEVVYAAGLDDVAVVETSINLCDHANIVNLLPVAKRRDIGVIAKRPIANAPWIGAEAHAGFYVDYVRTYVERLEKMGLQPSDLGFDGPANEAWPEIALRFTIAQDGLTTAIVGTTKAARIAANIAAAEKGPLPAPAVQQIRDAFDKAEAADGKPWPGMK